MSSLQKALKQSHEQRATYSSSSDDDDNTSVDTNEEQRKKNEMMKIRQQAFDLLNKSEPTKHDPAKGLTPENPHIVSYQHQSAGEQSFTTAGRPTPSSNPYSMHSPHMHPQARTADQMSMKDLVVNCISDVCRSSSSEILSKGVALVSAGYKSVSNYGDKPVSGTFDSIDTSQHGYGNSNYKNDEFGTLPSRYQD